jgi:hypothetical protein
VAEKFFLQLSDVILMVSLSVVHSTVDMNKFERYAVDDVIYVYYNTYYIIMYRPAGIRWDLTVIVSRLKKCGHGELKTCSTGI